MAGKSDFTPAEWTTLLESVMMAGIAVTAADPSGLWGTIKESMASAHAVMGATRDVSANQLIKAVTSEFETGEALAEDERRTGLFREYPADFFDLIIVDECHRGSARDTSSWRSILEYFTPAYQLGMTATPLREETRDTYLYFGNPIYEYSLRQGIEDGFLAPYRVHRIITEWDAAGFRPSQGELDRYGRAIPDDEYQTKDFGSSAQSSR